MTFSGKALYNLFFLQGQQEYGQFAALPPKELFSKLKKLGLPLSEEKFVYLAETLESPEEMVANLKIDPDKAEEIYLIIFELWKHLVPDKKTISLFCDELDHCIHEYDTSREACDEELQEKLFLLQDILDSAVDEKEKPKETFLLVSRYLAHDLESFLYDYIYEQIEKEKDTLASELLDGFYPYIQETLWFDYLRLALFFHNPGEELTMFCAHFIDKLMAKPNMELLFEVLELLLEQECYDLFLPLFRFTMKKTTTNGHLAEMLALAGDLSGEKSLYEEGIKMAATLPSDGKIKELHSWYQKLLQV